MNRRGLKFLAVLALLLCIVVTALRLLPLSYSAAVASGKQSIAAVRDFEQTFPNSSHSIMYFTGTHGTTTWRSEALVHERYTVTMHMPVRLNALRNRVASFDEPQFWLVEVREVSTLPDGRTVIEYGPAQVTFGPRDWQRVVDSGGDLGRLGIHVDTDRPVPGLAKEWRRTNP
jgi:hypothetical protein